MSWVCFFHLPNFSPKRSRWQSVNLWIKFARQILWKVTHQSLFLPLGKKRVISWEVSKIAQKNRTKPTSQEILSTAGEWKLAESSTRWLIFHHRSSFSLISWKTIKRPNKWDNFFPSQKWRKKLFDDSLAVTKGRRTLSQLNFWRQKWFFLFWNATWQPRVPKWFTTSFFDGSILVRSERKVSFPERTNLHFLRF